MKNKKPTYCLVTSNSLYSELYSNLTKKGNEKWILIDKKSDFEYKELLNINPSKIFIPHWSEYIDSKIYENFECILFHMTDLPFGRGGSPLQNLIVKGHKKTKITAIRVTKGIDEGPFYLKRDLELNGSAEEIFIRAGLVIEKMIYYMLERKILPKNQKGSPEYFIRRKPEDGDLSNLNSLSKIYDYIRMLDSEGYPKAFIEKSKLKFEFTDAKINENSIIANVRIFKKK
jgi:methionyl-tRNA formyltransferase